MSWFVGAQLACRRRLPKSCWVRRGRQIPATSGTGAPYLGASIGRSLVRDDLAMKENLDLEDKAGSEYCEYELCMERTKPSRRLRNGGLFLACFVSSGRLEGWELSTLLLPQFLRWIYGTCTVQALHSLSLRCATTHVTTRQILLQLPPSIFHLSQPSQSTIAIQLTSPMHRFPLQ